MRHDHRLKAWLEITAIAGKRCGDVLADHCAAQQTEHRLWSRRRRAPSRGRNASCTSPMRRSPSKPTQFHLRAAHILVFSDATPSALIKTSEKDKCRQQTQSAPLLLALAP